MDTTSNPIRPNHYACDEEGVIECIDYIESHAFDFLEGFDKELLQKSILRYIDDKNFPVELKLKFKTKKATEVIVKCKALLLDAETEKQRRLLLAFSRIDKRQKSCFSSYY